MPIDEMRIASLLSTGDVAEIFGLSTWSINKMVRDGRLRAVHFGVRRRRFRIEDVRACIENAR